MTIDAHHHVLDPARYAYPWIDQARKAIDRPFAASDGRVVDLASALTSGCSSSERREIFRETAARVYALDPMHLQPG